MEYSFRFAFILVQYRVSTQNIINMHNIFRLWVRVRQNIFSWRKHFLNREWACPLFYQFFGFTRFCNISHKNSVPDVQLSVFFPFIVNFEILIHFFIQIVPKIITNNFPLVLCATIEIIVCIKGFALPFT